MSHRS